MNSLQLKIIAIITMIIDHIGYFFFSENIIFRLIGRLSFPIFAFLLTNTIKYSNNLEKKEKKLLLFACLIEIIKYVLNMNITNIFISMIVAINIIINKNKKATIFNMLLITYLSIKNNSFSMLYEILFIIILYKNKNQNLNISYLIILILTFYLISTLNLITTILYTLSTLVGLLIIKKYNRQYGNKKIHQILWYIYPLHLILIYIIGKCI